MFSEKKKKKKGQKDEHQGLSPMDSIIVDTIL